MSETHDVRFPNESTDYREARNELLEAERKLRQQVERVAELRRGLPAGGDVPEDYEFVAGPRGREDEQGQNRTVRLSELFDDGKDVLVAYSFMYGPEMSQPCPMCTSFIDALNGNAPDLERRVNLAVIAKSPLDRIRAFATRRGWDQLQFLSSSHNNYNDDYFGTSPSGGELPMLNVFVRDGDAIRHFWGSELLFLEPEEHQDPRHIDMMWPLWNVLDATPQGRGEWYPGLDYK